MKSLFIAIAVCFSINNAYALDKVISVEGPVKVIVPSSPSEMTTYTIQDPQRGTYTVVLPENERVKFASAMTKDANAPIRFDGTVVDRNGQQVLNVTGWKTVTTTTTVTDDLGNSKTYRDQTTTAER